MNNFVIGLDYGSDSVRAVLVNADSGEEIASATHLYQRWKEKKYCNAAINQFRQHPLDHIEGLETTIQGVLSETSIDAHEVRGICIDTTGSSPMAVTKDGISLAMQEEFKDNPNAMMVLWKDHTAIDEANEINDLARNWGGTDFTKYEGGIYSSEWFWAKILHIIREDDAVKEAAFSWMEHCDWLTFLISDHEDLATFKRSRCAAGHKAMWHEEWGGLPQKDFLEQLDPYLAELKDHLYEETYTSNEFAGHLNEEWAEKLGLSTDCVIAVGTFDAHAGAVGAKIEEGALVRVMGTSTCDMMISSYDKIGTTAVKGICGQVDGSIIPGMVGLEAGQSAFGDVLAWFRDILSWPIDHILHDQLSEKQKQNLKDRIIPALSKQAELLTDEEVLPVALDWINGRRTPDANQELKAAISQLSLGTKAPHLFAAFVHAICFGAKKIVDRFQHEGVRVDTVIGIGGVARKSPYIMQTLANVLNMPIKVAASDQAPALGAAIYAAVAAGVFENTLQASQVMGSSFEAEYLPQQDGVQKMKTYFREYEQLAEFVEKQTNE